MLLTGIYVNIGVLKAEKDKLSDKAQINLEMLEEDYDRLVKKIQGEEE